jgi:outer membrane protein TolC
VNEENLTLLQDLRKTVLDRYTNNLAPEQDLRQTEVEIGRQQERLLTLRRVRHVAIARINTLMHLPPDVPLPPSPKQLSLGTGVPKAHELRAIALAQRPDLRASADRITAEQAALALAQKEWYPDFEVMAAYDAFWQPDERDLRPQLGIRLNLPVRKDRRYAAIVEAAAMLAQRQAEYAGLADQVNFQVHQAFEQVRESERVVSLYEQTILPAAQQNIKAALAGYTTAKVPFLSLIEARRNLVMLRDRYYEAIADYHRRRATLERVVGRPLPAAIESCPVP